MKILVTGGAGFIGSHIVDRMVEDGHDTVVMDNLFTGDKLNINKKVKFYEMDILSSDVDEVFKNEKFDAIFHLAANIDIRRSVKDPIHDATKNILGTLNLLEMCRKYSVNKFIFSSTGGALYGDANIIPTLEDYPTKPISPYGVSKLSSEDYLYYYNKIHGIKVTILRYSNVYGPRQGAVGEGGVVSIFIKKILEGKSVEIHGDGKQTRDFVFVRDVANANFLALSLPNPNTSDFEVYNIGSSIETDVNKLYKIISDKLDVDKPPLYGDALVGEVFRSALDNTKAVSDLDWKPKYDLEQGIEETIAYFEER